MDDPEDLSNLHLRAAELLERAAYVVTNASAIPVRVAIDGRFQNRYLTELPPVLAIEQAFRLLLRADVPHARVARMPFEFPRYCGGCGAFLMGGATEHKKPCPLMDGLLDRGVHGTPGAPCPACEAAQRQSWVYIAEGYLNRSAEREGQLVCNLCGRYFPEVRPSHGDC